MMGRELGVRPGRPATRSMIWAKLSLCYHELFLGKGEGNLIALNSSASPGLGSAGKAGRGSGSPLPMAWTTSLGEERTLAGGCVPSAAGRGQLMDLRKPFMVVNAVRFAALK